MGSGMAKSKIPGKLVKMVEECPFVRGRVRRADVLSQLKEGKLDEIAAKYAKEAAYNGTDGGFWNVWLEVQRARKLGVDESIDELRGEQRRWFAKWCFDQNQDLYGIAAYRKYLDHHEPGDIGPFDAENTIYLDSLIRAGRDDDVLRTVSELEKKLGQLAWEKTRAAQVQYAQGKTNAARKVFDDLLEQYHDDGQLEGQIALVYHRLGETTKAEEILRRAISHGVYYEKLVDELRETFSMSEQEWETLAEGNAGGFDFEQHVRQWWLNPVSRLQASKRATSHWFGGDDFKTTKCKGCGHFIRQYFLLDIGDIPNLRQQLPSWTLLPLLGCNDCMVWMGRHDYKVDTEKMRVKLETVTLPGIKQFSEAMSKTPAFRKQFAQLKTRKPKKRLREADLDAYGIMDSMVGGLPPWIADDPPEIRCRHCNEEMTFVAAIGNIEEFEPQVAISSECGYQYHFACDDCHTLSVIAQWS